MTEIVRARGSGQMNRLCPTQTGKELELINSILCIMTIMPCIIKLILKRILHRYNSGQDQQPNGASMEDCSCIQLDSVKPSGNWHDVPCAYTGISHYMCKKQILTNQGTSVELNITAILFLLNEELNAICLLVKTLIPCSMDLTHTFKNLGFYFLC